MAKWKTKMREQEVLCVYVIMIIIRRTNISYKCSRGSRWLESLKFYLEIHSESSQLNFIYPNSRKTKCLKPSLTRPLCRELLVLRFYIERFCFFCFSLFHYIKKNIKICMKWYIYMWKIYSTTAPFGICKIIRMPGICSAPQ